MRAELAEIRDEDVQPSAATRISVIVPMLNEASHVESMVHDIAAQDCDGDVELLVADGGSTDGSPARLLAAAQRAGIAARVVHNPARWVSHGLNLCIAAATGDVLVRLDCHSRYPPDYLRRCATALQETNAHVVGGIIVATGRTTVERSVACAMDTSFGGIGFYRIVGRRGGPLARLAGAFGLARAHHADTGGRLDTETVTMGAYRPETFALAGGFDESVRRNQDSDLNLRVRRAGGRVVLDPAIKVHYTPRGSLRAVFRQYHEYGYWRLAVMLRHRERPGPRTVAPFGFVTSLALLAPAALRVPLARRVLAAELAAYGGLALAVAAATVRRRGESPALVPLVAAVFPAFHVGHGSGMARTLAGEALRTLRRRRAA